MKKTFFMAAIVAALMGLSSCESTRVVNGIQWKIADCEVRSVDWQYTYNTDQYPKQYANNYFYAKFDVPMLTQTVFDDGNVQCYLVENVNGTQMQRQLPFTRHHETFIQTGTGEVTKYYTETYDCIYGIGWVEFNYVASDFAYEPEFGNDYRPASCQFRVVMTW